jgi:hypothetical protein
MGSSMIKYTKKVVLWEFNFKNTLFNIHIQKDIWNLFKLHFEIIELFIEFIVSWT